MTPLLRRTLVVLFILSLTGCGGTGENSPILIIDNSESGGGVADAGGEEDEPGGWNADAGEVISDSGDINDSSEPEEPPPEVIRFDHDEFVYLSDENTISVAQVQKTDSGLSSQTRVLYSHFEEIWSMIMLADRSGVIITSGRGEYLSDAAYFVSADGTEIYTLIESIESQQLLAYLSVRSSVVNDQDWQIFFVLHQSDTMAQNVHDTVLILSPDQLDVHSTACRRKSFPVANRWTGQVALGEGLCNQSISDHFLKLYSSSQFESSVNLLSEGDGGIQDLWRIHQIQWWNATNLLVGLWNGRIYVLDTERPDYIGIFFENGARFSLSPDRSLVALNVGEKIRVMETSNTETWWTLDDTVRWRAPSWGY